MNLIKHTLSFFCFLYAISSHAQDAVKDTARALHTVEVAAPYTRALSTGNRIQLLDSELLNKYTGSTIGELLNTESDIYIKSYGLGTLATTSIRGGGSNHTAILWNGFNLQNPMYGPQDLSLLSTGFFNEVMLQYGSSGATWGSGAVGGAIHLNNRAAFNKGISVFAGASLASFADQQQQAGIEFSKKRFISSLKLINHTAKNNFPFENTMLPEKPIQKQTNAELKQTGLLNENYFQINERQKVNVRFWYQTANRNIPPSLSQETNSSNQRDESLRVTSEWQRVTGKLILTARAAYFYETLQYQDTTIDLHSQNKTTVTIAEAEGKFKLTKADLLTVAINNTYSEARAGGYEKNPHQNRLAFIASYKIQNKPNTLRVFFNVRQEFIQPDNHTVDTITPTPFKSNTVYTNASRPFTYSLGGEGDFFKQLSFNFNVAQHYRIPTFNDLYWLQGGNIHLKPESGWGEELGITLKKNLNKLSATLNITVFNRNIDNWILWTPTAAGYWQPDNIMKVWSRGAEYRFTLNFPVRKVCVVMNTMWDYTVSTVQRVAVTTDAALGKQLIYTPMYKGNASLTLSYKKFSFTYHQKYVGYTYTSSDNKYYLSPYFISNIKAAHLFNIAGFHLQLFAAVNNLFDNRYQVIENRAMPGRNYQAGCNFYFTKSNNLND